jgi:hypothetical protein
LKKINSEVHYASRVVDYILFMWIGL